MKGKRCVRGCGPTQHRGDDIIQHSPAAHERAALRAELVKINNKSIFLFNRGIE